MINLEYKKVFSQNGEDGILEFLLANCENLNFKCIELGVGDGMECNTAYLVKKKYNGIFIDKINDFNVDFYHGCDYKFINRSLETDNISDIFREYGLVDHYDVFSLDIDGIDYWILKKLIELELFTSSIIVLEYQDIIGPEKSITIPNIKNFNAWEYDNHGGPNYCGASLKAFVNLLSENYIFVGCEYLGFNGFFVNKNQIKLRQYELIDIYKCFEIEKVKKGMTDRWPRVENKIWIPV